jgi:hypothetical protein
MMNKRRIAALSSVTALIAAAATYTAVSVGAAAAEDGYSTDPSNPTLVSSVPDGFAPYGEPVVTTEHGVTTTRQVYSRTIAGSSGVFTEWRPDGFSAWSAESTAPADPDGQSGEDDPLNLSMVGTPMETRTVIDQEATEGQWTDWADSGSPVKSEENTCPGEDTDTVRWLYVGTTAPEVVVHAQHYSWTGGPIDEGDVPPIPPVGSWQANTTQEPHAHGHGDHVTWLDGVGHGLHYTGEPGNANWFYFQEEVTDVDHLWQKQVREWVPGTPEVTHDEFRWPLLTRTYTPGTEDVTEYVYTVVVTGSTGSDAPNPPAEGPAVETEPPAPPADKPVRSVVPTTIDAGL